MNNLKLGEVVFKVHPFFSMFPVHCLVTPLSEFSHFGPCF